MTNFLLTWAITAVSLLMISALRLGIEIKSLGTALVAALVLGVLNAIVRPILGFLALPITILTLGLFALVLNALMIMLMAALVKGVNPRVSVQKVETNQSDFRAKLRQDLTDYFSEEELRTLCFDMALDYESLPAQGKAGKAREIVAQVERNGATTKLIEQCRLLRPNVQWMGMPEMNSDVSTFPGDIVPERLHLRNGFRGALLASIILSILNVTIFALVG